ncbi:hypothetical protein [Pontiella agarivorans]|uniref:Uncharacterized protein n=1 Tax=Pontiella agarivorans TaxID=3038953 RepID=A0ABU5MWA7_9BACT|nr:hypothetical protein [Pontiella agarivorans]MDZ8118495.1 hypothetical protein [Pontiella agarivorans]
MKKIIITISALICLNGCSMISSSPSQKPFEIPQEEYNSLSEKQRSFYDSLTPSQKNDLERERRMAGYKNQIRSLDSQIKQLEVSLKRTEKENIMSIIVDIDMLKKERMTAQKSLDELNQAH